MQSYWHAGAAEANGECVLWFLTWQEAIKIVNYLQVGGLLSDLTNHVSTGSGSLGRWDYWWYWCAPDGEDLTWSSVRWAREICALAMQYSFSHEAQLRVMVFVYYEASQLNTERYGLHACRARQVVEPAYLIFRLSDLTWLCEDRHARCKFHRDHPDINKVASLHHSTFSEFTWSG